ncbi:hypothetical protein K431DRAFT_281149 [Polychaeton citri CBS 116435]|uniref:Altered inheritance of mitochondria protein 6 n=1 Tax=Polychaeton citri CBS 116435 TaxID=1314669 RepID=A0A9P4USM5_9PEZI|nr:hypothetical protein K431DRAFT_281149 [Polychaeton citri CBS 116435]
MLATLLAVTCFFAASTDAQADASLSQPLQKILSQAHKGDLYTYPTALTQGIIPKAFHSHNDYWRPLPFYSALSVGTVSVEADVWLYNGTLHVGHEESALTNARTFSSLYIQPITDVLRQQNPNSSFITDGPTKNGVFDTASGQTLYLFVDVKTDGPTTWPYVVKALKPLRDAGYLTTYDSDNGVTSGPVTVIGTGNTPLNQVQGVSPRDFFYDAHLPALNDVESNITSDVSPIASTDFAAVFGEVRNQTFNATQLSDLNALVETAHARGIGARFWDQPGWPIGTRNAIWRILWDAGVDLLNVDDLQAAASFWESTG